MGILEKLVEVFHSYLRFGVVGFTQREEIIEST
jgi:hypothetical protein